MTLFITPFKTNQRSTPRKSLPLQLTLEEVLAFLAGASRKKGIYYVLVLGRPGKLSKYTNIPFKLDNNPIHPIINLLTKSPRHSK